MAKNKPHKRKSLFMGITSRVLMTIAAALLVLSYLSMFFNPSRVWFMTLLGIIFIPVWILNVFLFIWALFRRSSAIMIPLVALIPTLFIVGRFYQFPKNAEKFRVLRRGRFCRGCGRISMSFRMVPISLTISP